MSCSHHHELIRLALIVTVVVMMLMLMMMMMGTMIVRHRVDTLDIWSLCLGRKLQHDACVCPKVH